MFTCLHVYMLTRLHVYMFTCLHVYIQDYDFFTFGIFQIQDYDPPPLSNTYSQE